MDAVGSVVAQQSAQVGSQVAVSVAKIALDAEKDVANLVANVAESGKAALPPGLGAVLDRTA